MDAHEQVNILMVDDQPARLLSYEAVLRELGENLITARSGREALAHLLQTDMAVVLIDVNMPEINGFELATMIRQHPRHQQTAILFISGLSLTDFDMLKGYEHGAVDYITIPIIPELLRAKVRIFAELYRKTAALKREIAERQRLEREARRTEHFTLLGRLAASVSHEIRNPLSAVVLHVDLLEEEMRQPSLDSAETTAQSFTEIKTQLARLDDLLQEYLSLARVATMERTPQDLGALVHAWTQEWQPLAATQRVILQCEGMERLGTVPLHASTFRRAILNLVQNALDAMPQCARVQFGRPIGSFQAIKHKCAEMMLQVESAKSAAYYAAWAVEEDAPEAPLAVSMAKAYCSDAYRYTAGEGIQVHGGIGFTWEHDMHLYFKRAKYCEFTFGDATYHRELVAQEIHL